MPHRDSCGASDSVFQRLQELRPYRFILLGHPPPVKGVHKGLLLRRSFQFLFLLQFLELTEEIMASYLYSADVPDPELIIRPSGELRTSNFLLWQSAYSEFVFMNVMWPDFGPADLDAAIEEYHRRNRRFGGV